jgi:hypothetical protein
VPIFGELFVEEPLPDRGFVDLSDAPGWGVELNHKLNLIRPYSSSHPPRWVNHLTAGGGVDVFDRTFVVGSPPIRWWWRTARIVRFLPRRPKRLLHVNGSNPKLVIG